MKQIKILSTNYQKVDDIQSIITSLGRVYNMYRFSLDDPERHLESLLSEYEEMVKEAIKETENRIATWKKCLFKYYKMTQIGGRENEDKYVSYIYPYLVVDSNSTVWMLEVKEGDNYNGGVIDHNYTVDENWNCDITLEEITKEEFSEHAKKAVDYVIERRLRRIEEDKERKSTYKATKNQSC